MRDRRNFIKTLASLALALPFAPGLASGFAGRAAAAAAAPPQEFFIVNGWVLTRADLEALKLDDR